MAIENELRLVRKWFEEAGYPSIDEKPILSVAASISVAKAHFDREVKNGKILRWIAAEVKETQKAAQAVKTLKRRLQKLALAYKADNESVPPEIEQAFRAIEDASFHLAPIGTAYANPGKKYQYNIRLIRDCIVLALQSAGRDETYVNGSAAGKVMEILSKALEYIDGKTRTPGALLRWLNRDEEKSKQQPAR